MIKQITDKSSDVAAEAILGLIAKHGGNWIVNAIGGDGYIVMLDGTAYAAQLKRSGSPCLCGPFGEGKDHDDIKAALIAARGGERTKPRKEHIMTGIKARICAELRLRKLSAVEVAERVKGDKDSVRIALNKLVKQKRVRKTGEYRRRVSTGRAAVVYSAVA